MPTTEPLTAADLFTAPELDRLQPSDLAGVKEGNDADR